MVTEAQATLPSPPSPGPGSDQFLTALATEHFTLQGSRASTVAEAGARSTLFMGTVSSFVVALAFVGTISGAGRVFDLFALTLLPVLFALGLLTYMRLSESALEDAFYARAINRIRRYYTALDPERSAYLALSANDDLRGVMLSSGRVHTRWHALSHTATMVLVVTAAIAGVGAGLFASTVIEASHPVSAVGGAIVGAVMVTVALMIEHRRWNDAAAAMPTLFPTPPAQKPGAHRWLHLNLRPCDPPHEEMGHP